jgi:hypothetical protein
MTIPGRSHRQLGVVEAFVSSTSIDKGLPKLRSRLVATSALIALAFAGCGGQHSHPQQASDGAGRSPAAQVVARAARADRAQIRDVIRRFNQASLAGDSGGICALVDPSKLRYLEQIGQPCEVSLGGTLTAESARDVRSSTITSIEITGDDAVAHIGGTSGARDLRLRRRGGHWLILGA